MKIDQHSKIATLIKFNSDSIDAIAALAKPLQKLKNPILRKLFAARITIAEAAKIANCSVLDFKQVLVPLGFVWDDEEAAASNSAEGSSLPVWMTVNNKIEYLDVRPILDAGKDPLKDIFKAYAALADQAILCVVNTFVPLPLIHRLEDKGACAYVETIGPKEINTYFFKATNSPVEAPEKEQVIFVSLDTFTDKLAAWSPDKVVHTDVRSFAMPKPMETILDLLQTLPTDHVLAIQHKKIPLYLLEELVDKNYKIYICKKEEEDVRILIHTLKD